MNLVKKSIAALLCTAVCTSAGVTAFAAESQDVALSHVVENDPVYSLTIPSSLDMEKNGSEFTFEATGVQYMDGKKISVTIGGTDYFRNQMGFHGERLRHRPDPCGMRLEPPALPAQKPRTR